jgi:hypothetical protein
LHVQLFHTAGADLPIRRLSAADLAACVELAADSSYGRPLYQSMGFRGIDTVTRHAGRFAPRPPAALPRSFRPASMSDREPITALDRKVFGADRRRVLTELFGFADSVRQRDADGARRQPAG